MSFTKIHLGITRDTFEARDKAGQYQPLAEPLFIKPVQTNYDMFALLTHIVGGPYDWHKRREYHEDAEYQSIKSTIEDKSSRLWLFMHEHEIIGYCQTANVESGASLSSVFDRAVEDVSVAEIFKVGLFPEYTGKKLGHMFVPAVLRELLNKHDAVYLNTRDTNHEQVVTFYQELGLSVLKTETLRDDLIEKVITPPAP